MTLIGIAATVVGGRSLLRAGQIWNEARSKTTANMVQRGMPRGISAPLGDTSRNPICARRAIPAELDCCSRVPQSRR